MSVEPQQDSFEDSSEEFSFSDFSDISEDYDWAHQLVAFAEERHQRQVWSDLPEGAWIACRQVVLSCVPCYVDPEVLERDEENLFQVQFELDERREKFSALADGSVEDWLDESKEATEALIMNLIDQLRELAQGLENEEALERVNVFGVALFWTSDSNPLNYGDHLSRMLALFPDPEPGENFDAQFDMLDQVDALLEACLDLRKGWLKLIAAGDALSVIENTQDRPPLELEALSALQEMLKLHSEIIFEVQEQDVPKGLTAWSSKLKDKLYPDLAIVSRLENRWNELERSIKANIEAGQKFERLVEQIMLFPSDLDLSWREFFPELADQIFKAVKPYFKQRATKRKVLNWLQKTDIWPPGLIYEVKSAMLDAADHMEADHRGEEAERLREAVGVFCSSIKITWRDIWPEFEFEFEFELEFELEEGKPSDEFYKVIFSELTIEELKRLSEQLEFLEEAYGMQADFSDLQAVLSEVLDDLDVQDESSEGDEAQDDFSRFFSELPDNFKDRLIDYMKLNSKEGAEAFIGKGFFEYKQASVELKRKMRELNPHSLYRRRCELRRLLGKAVISNNVYEIDLLLYELARTEVEYDQLEADYFCDFVKLAVKHNADKALDRLSQFLPETGNFSLSAIKVRLDYSSYRGWCEVRGGRRFLRHEDLPRSTNSSMTVPILLYAVICNANRVIPGLVKGGCDPTERLRSQSERYREAAISEFVMHPIQLAEQCGAWHAKAVLENLFGVEVGYQPRPPRAGPSVWRSVVYGLKRFGYSLAHFLYDLVLGLPIQLGISWLWAIRLMGWALRGGEHEGNRVDGIMAVLFLVLGLIKLLAAPLLVVIEALHNWVMSLLGHFFVMPDMQDNLWSIRPATPSGHAKRHSDLAARWLSARAVKNYLSRLLQACLGMGSRYLDWVGGLVKKYSQLKAMLIQIPVFPCVLVFFLVQGVLLGVLAVLACARVILNPLCWFSLKYRESHDLVKAPAIANYFFGATLMLMWIPVVMLILFPGIAPWFTASYVVTLATTVWPVLGAFLVTLSPWMLCAAVVGAVLVAGGIVSLVVLGVELGLTALVNYFRDAEVTPVAYEAPERENELPDVHRMWDLKREQAKNDQETVVLSEEDELFEGFFNSPKTVNDPEPGFTWNFNSWSETSSSST